MPEKNSNARLGIVFRIIRSVEDERPDVAVVTLGSVRSRSCWNWAVKTELPEAALRQSRRYTAKAERYPPPCVMAAWLKRERRISKKGIGRYVGAL